jgi:hypothetical protein
MKIFKSIALLLLFLTLNITAQAKDIQKTIYVFGFAASFNDSTVYFTNIQQVDGAWIKGDRTHFLINRDDYSYQFRNFLNSIGEHNRTCVTIYDDNQASLEKKLQKMKAKYTTSKKARGRYLVRNLDNSAFTYEAVAPDEGNIIVNAEEAEKAANQSAKEEKKQK